jgi:hypothetical protein
MFPISLPVSFLCFDKITANVSPVPDSGAYYLEQLGYISKNLALGLYPSSNVDDG